MSRAAARARQAASAAPQRVAASDPAQSEALTDALAAGELEEATRALAKGASPDARDGYGYPAAVLAARGGFAELLQALKDAGADLEAREHVGAKSALIMAAVSGHSGCVRLLLAWGADTAAADSEGNTALHRAAEWGKLDCAQLLLDGGADRAARNRDGLTARQVLEGANWGSAETKSARREIATLLAIADLALAVEDDAGTSGDAQSREAAREARVAQEAGDAVAQWHAGGSG